jgi:hypothetical protein
MNHLAPAGADRWHLPQHAHIVVYDRNDRELVTVYDCGAAQKPPSAQLLGSLVRVESAAQITQTQTGYTASLREESVLERQDEDRYVVRKRK